MKNRLQGRATEKQSKMCNIVVFDEDIPKKDCRLTFVDFAPTLKYDFDTSELDSISFSEVVNYANGWLKQQDCWDVVNCETIAAIITITVDERGVITWKDILKTYTISEDTQEYKDNVRTWHVVRLCRDPVDYRVLLYRLWIRPFDPRDYNEKVRPIIPVLQYRDFEPKLLDKNNHQFESIDDVMKRLNQAINQEELNGKILNIQTLAFRADNQWQVNTETSQSRPWIGKIVYVLRVYYALGPIFDEEVGFADFIPQCLSGGSIFKRPKFESQQFILEKASKWLSDNPEINFCSAVSMDVKLKSMVSIDTKQMSAIRETGDYIRILRLAYTKPRDVPADIPESATLPPPPPVYLESRPFVLHKSYSEVKRSVNEFMNRQEWSSQAPDRYKWSLFSCETVPVFSSNSLKQSLETNSDQSFQAILSSSRSINRSEYFAVKIYFDVGYYGVDHQLPDKQGSQAPAAAAAPAVDTPTSTTSADGVGSGGDDASNDNDKRKSCTIM
ncbi:uncharacterized protein LOC128962077 [Oppia nitens]|uniref:uncharacterized protein LOC128962077 n=1 Tax=Oppia nitens TaxID=1686743 RepID=UPI0023DB4578|nr:uncharacterized protein LOC128962077 [Oppia nitens]